MLILIIYTYLQPFTRPPGSSKYENETTVFEVFCLLWKKMKESVNWKTEVLLEPSSVSITSGNKKKYHVATILLLTIASVWKQNLKPSILLLGNRTKIGWFLCYTSTCSDTVKKTNQLIHPFKFKISDIEGCRCSFLIQVKPFSWTHLNMASHPISLKPQSFHWATNTFLINQLCLFTETH